MASERATIIIERREDGGLRVYSDDIPGLILSHSDPRKVLADIAPALEVIAPWITAPPSPTPE